MTTLCDTCKHAEICVEYVSAKGVMTITRYWECPHRTDAVSDIQDCEEYEAISPR